MQEGDFARALEIARANEKTAAKLNNPMKAARPAFACELTGDFDAASENYEKAFAFE
ncbi:MAG: hypothetical protein IKU86_06860 [Thermoguttaceae bacterium]|nr:hypothetical protein [Thermoguttaceae bacterium]